MKKLALLFLAIVFATALAACDRVPEDVVDCLDNPDAPECQVCEDGYELDGTNCVPIVDPVVCETGYHEEDGQCVEDTVTCETGFHEEAGQCVEDPPTCADGEILVGDTCVIVDDRTPEEIIVDAIVENADDGLQFLATAMNSMDFSSALTMTTEFYFEVTEDIDETHYIDAEIVDSFLYDELGDTVKRTIYLDIDGEQQIEFIIIFQEVATGVHVYLQPEIIIDAITQGDPTAVQTVQWIGFDKEWAVFQFDDSLEQVIQIEVLKEMLVSLFFSEMGEDFFDVVQQDIEMAIGFDLDQYGVDLGLFIDYLIEEDFDSAELLLQGIQVEHIVLHLDYMYLAPQLHQVLQDYLVPLGDDGFDITKIDALNTATFDEIDEVWVIDPLLLPVDPLDMVGTEAFFASLTEAEVTSFIEIVIKPILENALYEQYLNDVNPEWLHNDFLAILNENEQFLIDNWPMESGIYDPLVEIPLFESLGPVEYWKQLTEQERGTIHWAIDMNNNAWVMHEFRNAMEDNWNYEWYLVRYEEEMDEQWLYDSLYNLIDNNRTQITNEFYDPDQWLLDLENQGVVDWYSYGDYHAREVIMSIANEVGNEHYLDPINQLEHIAQDPWAYREWFRSHNHFVDEQWLTDEFVYLIQSHQTYMTDEYGYDIPALITLIETEGAIHWYIDATEMDRDVLHEISLFDGEYSGNRWAVEEMERIYERLDEYYWWFGRNRELIWPEEITWQLEDFVYDNYQYVVDNSMYNPDVWLEDIHMYGGFEWYNMLSEGERQVLEDAAQMNYYPWALDVVRRNNEHPGMYEWCWGNWENCHSDEILTENLVLLVNEYAGYLNDEYGIITADLISNIEMHGAVHWFYEYQHSYEFDAMLDVAEMSEWRYKVLWTIKDIMYQEEDLLDFLYMHETILNDAGFNATQKIADLEMYGITVFVADYLTPADIEILLDAYAYPLIEGLHTAVLDQEVFEFFMTEFFGNPHVEAILTEIGPNPVFDEVLLPANMMLVDLDALLLEVVDYEMLAQAVYDGQVAYDAFVLGLNATAPNHELILQIFSPGVLSLEEYMVYVDDLMWAFDGMVTFEQFINPMYYLDEIVDVTVVATEDVEVLTIMEIDGLGYAQMFNDLTEALNEYMMGFETVPFPFDENWVCLPEEMYCEEPEFAEIIAHLTTFGAIEAHILFDPNNATWYEVGIDLTELLDGIAAQNYADLLESEWFEESENNDIINGVNEFTVTVTMENTATIDLPAEPDTAVVNDIVEELAQFAIAMEGYEILRDYADYYEMDPTMLMDLYNSNVYLNEIEFLDFSAAFDLDMSYITISIDEILGEPDPTSLDYEIVLYWIDGTEVFDGPLGIADLVPLFLDGDLVSEAAYHQISGEINEANWAMTKLFLYYLWQPNNNNDEMYN